MDNYFKIERFVFKYLSESTGFNVIASSFSTILLFHINRRELKQNYDNTQFQIDAQIDAVALMAFLAGLYSFCLCELLIRFSGNRG